MKCGTLLMIENRLKNGLHTKIQKQVWKSIYQELQQGDGIQASSQGGWELLSLSGKMGKDVKFKNLLFNDNHDEIHSKTFSMKEAYVGVMQLLLALKKVKCLGCGGIGHLSDKCVFLIRLRLLLGKHRNSKEVQKLIDEALVNEKKGKNYFD